MIDQALQTIELEKGELLKLRKLDPKKAMIVRLVRKHTRVKLDWIARELRMGVQSGVTLAEKRLKEELKNDLNLRNLWRKIEKINHVSAPPLFLMSITETLNKLSNSFCTLD